MQPKPSRITVAPVSETQWLVTVDAAIVSSHRVWLTPAAGMNETYTHHESLRAAIAVIPRLKGKAVEA